MSETYFIREKKEKNYTVVDNTFIRDCTLSWKAKGVMVYLLSLPEDWKIYKSEVQKHATDGKDSLTSAINELKEHGYIVTENVKNEKGQFAGTIYKIVEKPLTENPTSGNPTLLNTNNTNYLYNNNSADAPVDKIKEFAQSLEENDKILQSKKSLLDREPKNDIEKVEKQYLLNYRWLYKTGCVIREKPVINWNASRKLTKMNIEKYGLQTILDAVNKAKNNDFCINGGYSLTTILSAGVLSRLINGTEKKHGSMINQLGVDEVNIKEEDIPF